MTNQSYNDDFNRLHKNLIQAAKDDRRKWLLINKIRNSNKIKSNMQCIKNVFNYFVSEPRKIANLLNYRFSDLGKITRPKRQIPPSSIITHKNFGSLVFKNAKMQLHCWVETSYWDRHQFLQGLLGIPALLFCHIFSI